MTNTTCSVNGCSQDGQLRRGMCDAHYRRWKRSGDPGPAAIATPVKHFTDGQRKPCSVHGCDREAIIRGWCRRCYERWKRTGTTDAPQPKTRCPQNHPYDDENTYVDTKGSRHCRTCRRAAAIKSHRTKRWPPCLIPDCGRKVYGSALGWCPSHVNRFRRYGDPLAGPPIRDAKLHPEEKRRRSLAACRAYHLRHRDRLNAAHRARYDREASREAARRWREKNPERWRAISYAARDKRRARMMSVPFEFVDYTAVLATHGMTCHICTLPIDNRKLLEFDHVVPIARGGSHTFDNVRPSHRTCNRRKGKKLMSELIG